ncbi:MAG: ribosome maturation factor RimM [Anaerovoracaceae bacterium]|jgi:16S rRNA processing protein RimM
MIKIGKIINVVGIKGELKIYHYTDYKERFEELSKVYLDGQAHDILNVRYMKELVILTLKGIQNRTEAEKHKNKELYIDDSDVRELPENTYYVRDLIGLTVEDEKGIKIGTLKDVIQIPAQDTYEIEKENGDTFLIPAVKEFILHIDLENKLMKVKLIDGLMDL